MASAVTTKTPLLQTSRAGALGCEASSAHNNALLSAQVEQNASNLLAKIGLV
jgi:hypothetical protein